MGPVGIENRKVIAASWFRRGRVCHNGPSLELNLNVQAGLAPVSPLGVVSGACQRRSFFAFVVVVLFCSVLSVVGSGGCVFLELKIST